MTRGDGLEAQWRAWPNDGPPRRRLTMGRASLRVTFASWPEGETAPAPLAEEATPGRRDDARAEEERAPAPQAEETTFCVAGRSTCAAGQRDDVCVAGRRDDACDVRCFRSPWRQSSALGGPMPVQPKPAFPMRCTWAEGGTTPAASWAEERRAVGAGRSGAPMPSPVGEGGWRLPHHGPNKWHTDHLACPLDQYLGPLHKEMLL